MKNNNPTLIDFFCGAGGFSEGFKQAGFTIVNGFDNWQPAIDTYNFNFDNRGVLKDIRDFWNDIKAIESLPDTDIIVGSPPCISFSMSNKSGKANKDLGLALIKSYLRIVAVKKMKPDSILKSWCMENVVNSQRFLQDYYTFEDLNLRKWSKDNGYSSKMIAIDLRGKSFIVNSADYGSFQQRKRSLTGEIIKGKKVFPLIQMPDSKKHKTLGDFKKIFPSPYDFKNSGYIRDPNYNFKLLKRKITDHFYDTGVSEHEWKQSRFKKINHPFMGKMYFPERLEKPSRTIMAQNILISREAIYYKCELKRKGDGEFRTPTLREAASLMSFPITYQFIGNESNKWRLVGNAVCPCVSRNIGERILKLFNYKNIFLVRSDVEIDGIQKNLNTYALKQFRNKSKAIKSFKQHIFKNGNMTVSFTNKTSKTNYSGKNRRWLMIAQYGRTRNIRLQEINQLQATHIQKYILKNCSTGKKFINAFEKKLKSIRNSDFNDFNPMKTLESLETLISKFDDGSSLNISKNLKFIPIEYIPQNQLYAMFAINKLADGLNRKICQ